MICTDGQHYPPCAYVDMVLGRVTGTADMSFQEIAEHPHVAVAREMRADPGWTDASRYAGRGPRGVAYAWSQHDDKYGYQRGDALSGEIDA